MRMKVLAAAVALLAAYIPAAEAQSDAEFAQRIFKEAAGDRSDAKLPDQFVRTMLRGVLEQHVSMALAMAGDFRALSKMYNALAEKGFVLPDGDSAAVAYLDSAKPFVLGIMMPETAYGEWKAKEPQSPLPHLLYASTRMSRAAEYTRAAIFVRDVDRSHPVNAAELDAVRSYLVANKHTAAKSGYWYNLMVEIAILRKSGGADVKRLVQEGLEAFPDNVQLAVLGSVYFLPNWHGDAKALEEYAVWAADLPALKGRKDIYGQIYAEALRNHYGLTLFKFAEKHWDRLRPSLIRLVEKYPSERNSSLAGVVACLGGDRALTASIITQDTVNASEAYWMDRDAFGLCMNWVMGG